MKAYKVYYSAKGNHTSMVVLAEDETKLEEAIADKDRLFKPKSRWSSIESIQEMPLTNVLVTDLSVAELLTLMKNN